MSLLLAKWLPLLALCLVPVGMSGEADAPAPVTGDALEESGRDGCQWGPNGINANTDARPCSDDVLVSYRTCHRATGVGAGAGVGDADDPYAGAGASADCGRDGALGVEDLPEFEARPLIGR